MSDKYPDATRGQWEAVWNKLGGVDGVARFLRGETKVIPTDSITTASLDPIIRVNFSVRLSYPTWATEVMHPDLESVGHTEFSVDTLQFWLHPDQGVVSGALIYESLKSTSGSLSNCLGLRDLMAIQNKGIVFFRNHFKDRVIVGWKSTVRDTNNGHLRVPYISESCDGVVLCWAYVGNVFDSSFPAARFAS
jgi:hypothetical protein